MLLIISIDRLLIIDHKIIKLYILCLCWQLSVQKPKRLTLTLILSWLSTSINTLPVNSQHLSAYNTSPLLMWWGKHEKTNQDILCSGRIIAHFPVVAPAGSLWSWLKLTGSILNITFFVMARRVSHMDVANNNCSWQFYIPGVLGNCSCITLLPTSM